MFQYNFNTLYECTKVSVEMSSSIWFSSDRKEGRKNTINKGGGYPLVKRNITPNRKGKFMFIYNIKICVYIYFLLYLNIYIYLYVCVNK